MLAYPSKFSQRLKQILSLKVRKTKNGKTKYINPLQPSEDQVKMLESNSDISNFLNNLEPSKWLEVMKPFKDYLYMDKASIKISDQEERAKYIANKIKRDKIKNLVMMDGHGRMYFSILSELKTYINQVNITLVDTNATVNNWHKLFFSNKVNCVERNIYDIKPSDSVDNSTLIYMNFCGIGGMNGQKMLAEYLNSVQLKNKIQHIILSFSTARGATFKRSKGGIKRPDCERPEKWLIGSSYEPNTWLSESYVKNYKAKMLFEGPQKDFPTFLISFNKL